MNKTVKDNFKELESFLENIFLENINVNFFVKNKESEQGNASQSKIKEPNIKENDIKEANIKEIEIKEKCDDSIFRTLKDLEFEYIKTNYERNFLYDFKDETCKKSHIICRVRRERSLEDGGQNIILTLKKRVETTDNFKEYIEFESNILEDDLEKLEDVFNKSLLSISFVYEKFRHIFSIKDIDVELCVDVLPLIGRFIEIEGKREEIEKAKKLLTLTDKVSQKSNYISLLKSHKNGDGKEYRFSQHEAFLVAEKEIMLITNFWHSCSKGSCASCSSCGIVCNSCDSLKEN